MRGRVPRVYTQRLLKRRDGLIRAPLQREGESEAGVLLGRVRSAAHRFAPCLHGGVHPPHVKQQLAHVVMDVRIVGIELHERRAGRLAGFQVAPFIVHGRRAVQRILGLGGTAQGAQRQSQIMEGRSVVGVVRKNTAEQPLRIPVMPGLVMGAGALNPFRQAQTVGPWSTGAWARSGPLGLACPSAHLALGSHREAGFGLEGWRLGNRAVSQDQPVHGVHHVQVGKQRAQHVLT